MTPGHPQTPQAPSPETGEARPLPRYACDACHSRKVGCSRDPLGCRRCKAEGIDCSYSRSGIIRRSKRQTNAIELPPQKRKPPAGADSRTSGRPSPQFTYDKQSGTTYERLERFVGGTRHSLSVLASLLEEYATVWQSSSALEKLAKGTETDFVVFSEDQLGGWLDAFVAIQDREAKWLDSPAPDVLDHIAASRPQQVKDPAWLVMFYSVALHFVNSTNPSDRSTLAKLRKNLWLAFQDVRLLLEPDLASIQALLIMACYAEESMSPSLCWALVTRACTMLQALGVTHWRLDQATRERRTLLFWRLHDLDNTLALMLCRPPTFHREMTAMIALPALDQLLPARPYQSPTRSAVLFDAHYTHQMFCLSRIKADVWYCLHGPDSTQATAIRDRLDSWYRQAKEVLEASALAEKPLLNAADTTSVHHGLQMLSFQYYSLLVLLTVSSKQLRTHAALPSQQLLGLLPSLGDAVAEHDRPYACLLWQLLHCPLAAFGTLWGELAVKRNTHPEVAYQYERDLEQLPAFFGRLSARNCVAVNLQSITERIVQHVRPEVDTDHSKDHARQEAHQPHTAAQQSTDLRLDGVTDVGQLYTPASETLTPGLSITTSNLPSGAESLDVQLEYPLAWPEDSFLDAAFDWFSFGNQEVS